MDKTTISIILEWVIALLFFSGIASGFYAWAIGDIMASWYAVGGLVLWTVTCAYFYLEERNQDEQQDR